MMNKLKVGFVFDDSLDRTDGVQQYITTLARQLVKMGHEVRFLVGETNNNEEFEDKIHSMTKNFNVRGNKNTMSLPLPTSSSHVRDVLQREKFDILHVQTPYNPLMAGRVISHAPKSLAIVSSFHIVGSTKFEEYGSKVLSLLQKKTLQRIDKHLAVSDAAKSFAASTYGISCDISPNVVDLNKYSTGKSKKFLKGKNSTIVFIGRLVERKGCEYLLKALNELGDEALKGMRVNICGDGPLREDLESYVSEHGLGEQVVFHGYIDETEKADFLASADIAVFPSTSGESFGIVLIEAMAANNPVVLGGDNVGYKTVLAGRKNQLFDPENSKQLAGLIEDYLGDKDKLKQAKAWQRKRIRDFDVVKVASQLETIYVDTIASRQAKH